MSSYHFCWAPTDATWCRKASDSYDRCRGPVCLWLSVGLQASDFDKPALWRRHRETSEVPVVSENTAIISSSSDKYCRFRLLSLTHLFEPDFSWASAVGPAALYHALAFCCCGYKLCISRQQPRRRRSIAMTTRLESS